MHWLRVAALPVLMALVAARPAPDPDIAYELAPEMQGKTITALDVTIRLRADKSGITTLDWVDSWAGETRLAQWARDIRITGATSSPPLRMAGASPARHRARGS